jgi:hypothetical protein
MDEEANAYNAEIQERLKAVLTNIPPPFGILLQHMYHIGISQLNRFDAMLFSAARHIRQTTVHVLPVVINTHSTVYYGVQSEDSDPNSKATRSNPDESEEYYDNAYDSEEHKNEYKSSVCPLTPAHVDYILSGGNQEARAKI